MKFYDKYFKSNYEELITYYPRYYRDVFEMVEILKAEGRIADELEAHIEQAYLNNFVLTADLETVKIWEKILNITYSKPLTLDQRKRVIIGRISGYGHIGEPEIRGVIANYTDNTVAVDFARGVIYIVINGEIFDENNLLNTLLRRIPAHLALDMQIHIRRTFRQTLDISFGGATGSNFKLDPVGEDRVSRFPVDISYGGATASYFAPDPVGEDRTGRTGLNVGYSGFLEPGTKGIPLEAERAATGHTDGAGGVYYHTHTKSKLIG